MDPKRGCVVRSDVAQCSASRRASDGGESLAPTAGLPTSFATSESAALNFVVGGAKILADLAGGAGSGSGGCAGQDARGCRAGATAAADDKGPPAAEPRGDTKGGADELEATAGTEERRGDRERERAS